MTRFIKISFLIIKVRYKSGKYIVIFAETSVLHVTQEIIWRISFQKERIAIWPGAPTGHRWNSINSMDVYVLDKSMGSEYKIGGLTDWFADKSCARPYKIVVFSLYVLGISWQASELHKDIISNVWSEVLISLTWNMISGILHPNPLSIEVTTPH